MFGSYLCMSSAITAKPMGIAKTSMHFRQENPLKASQLAGKITAVFFPTQSVIC